MHPFRRCGAEHPGRLHLEPWGSLASFGAIAEAGHEALVRHQRQQLRRGGRVRPTRVRARAVTAGGESGNPASPHFNDEAQRYASGNLREVYFYPEQLKGHTERTYRPGE